MAMSFDALSGTALTASVVVAGISMAGGAAIGVWPRGLGVGWTGTWWAPKGTGTGIGVIETRRPSSAIFVVFKYEISPK